MLVERLTCNGHFHSTLLHFPQCHVYSCFIFENASHGVLARMSIALGLVPFVAGAPCFTDLFFENGVCSICFVCVANCSWFGSKSSKHAPGSRLGASWGAHGASNASRSEQEHNVGLCRPPFSDLV